jgi:hypothetical protein
MGKERNPSTPGPKPIPLSSDEIQDLASRGASWTRIADYLGLSDRSLRRRRAEASELDRAFARGRAELALALDSELLQVALLPIDEIQEKGLKGGLNAKVRAVEWAGRQFAGHSSETKIVIRDDLGREDLSGVSTEDLERRLAIVQKLADTTEKTTEKT